ncbi:hypothetical protein LDG_8764 [Legionella drancourtii LLAP12]|uniref:Uncharacterized protein n=1 Tax=Legionella drancourtii LLAP12 TaxID=658187 RepID=G9ETX7_9GAMM|nr:hypothetical protein LDG_8764 [Legionella drancourtii LLAP12]
MQIFYVVVFDGFYLTWHTLNPTRDDQLLHTKVIWSIEKAPFSGTFIFAATETYLSIQLDLN